MPATIKDVAAAAGVSTKTVTRALNGERYVGEATREKVRAAAAALGFQAPGGGRAVGGRGMAGQVALLYDAGDTHAVLGVAAGMQARCAVSGVRVIAQACGAARMEAVLGLIEATPLDGAILLPPLADDARVLSKLAERGVRTVLVAAQGGAAMPVVGVDAARAAAVMTRHLLALGHRRIGFVDRAGAVREHGHLAALAAAGIGDDPALFVEAAHDFAAGARAGAALLELAEPPTAVFAGSDTAAAGVLTAMHARGLRVPEDVSVAGFGDEALAAFVWPPLTTMRVSARALGEEAADLLLTGGTGRREIGFELVERASVIGIGI